MVCYEIFFFILCVAKLLLAQDIDDFSRNVCEENFGLDNLSCKQNGVQGVSCFNRDELCNNQTLCADGEDEGSMDSFSRIQCGLKDKEEILIML